jgi:AcrR family transcriptional regulator
MLNKKYMKIGELAELSGVHKTTIRFYLQGGLLPPPIKTGQTMAYYDERHLLCLNEIRTQQRKEKLPLAVLREKFAGQEDRSFRSASESVSSQPEGEAISTEQKQKKKRDILASATKVFSEKGYYQSTVNDVVLAADISIGTFYFYFKDKRDLYKNVVNELIRNISEKRDHALQGETDILKRVTIRGRAIYEHFEMYKVIIFLVRAEMDGDDEWAKHMAMKLYRTISESLMIDLQKGIDRGIIRPVDTKLTAYSLIGLIEIMSLLTNLEKGYGIDRIMEFLTDFVLKGLDPRNEKRDV